MVISHKDKWIYLATPKCASSSLDKMLEKQKHTNHNIDNSVGTINHMSYVECKQMLADEGVDIDDYFVFSFVRNPWSKIVSFYEWLKDGRCDYFDYLVSKIKDIIGDTEQKFDMSKFTFRVFIKNIETFAWKNLDYNFMLFENGENKLSFIGNIENFQEDFNIVCDKIGIPQQKLPHENKSKQKHYTEYYDDETREIVAKKYAKDIEYFGYKFGE